MHQQDAEQTKKVAEIGKYFLYEYSNRWSSVYDEIDEAYNFLAGRQYSKKQISYYESFRRLTDVFNLIFPKFNMIAGEVITSEIKNRIFPRPGGSPDVAEVFARRLNRPLSSRY